MVNYRGIFVTWAPGVGVNRDQEFYLSPSPLNKITENNEIQNFIELCNISIILVKVQKIYAKYCYNDLEISSNTDSF